MTEYQYKSVYGQAILLVKSIDAVYPAVGAYANLINKEASDGWEFYSMETVHVKQEAGASRETPFSFECKMLIFRKPK